MGKLHEVMKVQFYFYLSAFATTAMPKHSACSTRTSRRHSSKDKIGVMNLEYKEILTSLGWGPYRNGITPETKSCITSKRPRRFGKPVLQPVESYFAA